MARALRFDHVLIVVDDVAAVVEFFGVLGLEPVGPSTVVEGDWVDTTVGLEGVRSEIVMLQLPGSTTMLEISKFHAPVHPDGPQAPPANRFGLNNVAFEVDDLDAIVARLRADGHELLGGIAQYESFYRLCYVRGPEGIIVMLAEDISGR